MNTSLKIILTSACGALLALVGAESSRAQHDHGGGRHHQKPGHFHRHHEPSHFHRHHQHYDHHGGRTIFRRLGTALPAPAYQVVEAPVHSGPSYQPVFGAFSHIGELTMQLSREANALCLEMHYNHQHNPGFAQTYREAYEILATAKYLHGLEHSGNREELKQTALKLDKLFHHVQGDVVDWTARHHRQVGFGGLADKLDAVEATLHHLLDDVGARSQFPDASNSEAPPPVASLLPGQ